ncbi:hypothetical protein ABID42_002773 [Arcicella rosea]|uniref:hypothetical protein n=1 Tax=Arcicella rosea TaxID=502909 RepID=UPI00345E02E6
MNSETDINCKIILINMFNDRAILIKKKMKDAIIDRLLVNYKKVTIGILYESLQYVSNDFYKNEELFYECLDELKSENRINFKDIEDIYCIVYPV